jgi:hypothetical protein
MTQYPNYKKRYKEEHLKLLIIPILKENQYIIQNPMLTKKGFVYRLFF